MQLTVPNSSAEDLVRALLGDGIYLFLGAAFVTVGIVAGVFSVLGRKLNTLLLWLSLFALLDGARLWIQSRSLLILAGPSAFFERIRSAINYIIPIPGFLYLHEVKFLNRALTILAYIVSGLLVCLLMATLLLGPLPSFYGIHAGLMSITIAAFIVQSFRETVDGRDSVIIRRALLVYLACGLSAYIAGLLHVSLRLEPYGFAVLLGSLGYVAAYRTLRHEEQLSVIERELEIAKELQLSLLPSCVPRSQHFQIAARYVPVTSVAGDFYEFLTLDEQQAGLLIADVSGHGIAAALISSMVKLAATSLRSHAADPAELLAAMNRALYGNTQAQFVTAAYIYLDAALGELRYSAAGHPPMLLLRDGEVTPIEENGLLLAAFPFADYATLTLPMRAGDRFLLYTDGIVEADNVKKGEFGQENLSALLRQTAHLPPAEVADSIITAVQNWRTLQMDDLTVVVCDYV